LKKTLEDEISKNIIIDNYYKNCFNILRTQQIIDLHNFNQYYKSNKDIDTLRNKTLEEKKATIQIEKARIF
jgi:hypothetical protein